MMTLTIGSIIVPNVEVVFNYSPVLLIYETSLTLCLFIYFFVLGEYVEAFGKQKFYRYHDDESEMSPDI